MWRDDAYLLDMLLAARKVSLRCQQAHPEIPWQGIIGMRHRLVHEYFRIIPEKVWDVVEKDIPELIRLIEPIVPPDEPPDVEA